MMELKACWQIFTLTLFITLYHRLYEDEQSNTQNYTNTHAYCTTNR